MPLRWDVHQSDTHRLSFGSDHPDHPDTVRYRLKPRIVEQGRAVVSLGLWGSDEEENERVREVVAEHADALEGFETSDEYQPTYNLVNLGFEMLDREPDEEFVNAVVEKMVRMIQHYHPKLVNEVPDRED